MATRWTQRFNPLSWITRRGARTVPVAPNGPSEFTVPAAYQTTAQDDYSAATRPALADPGLEYFATHGDEDDQTFDGVISPTVSTYVSRGRPRTHQAEYDSSSQTLRVTFRDGTYDYAGVTPDQWVSLQRERTSTGKWLARNGLGGPGSGMRV